MTEPRVFTVLVALVGLERLAELVVSKRNAAWSLEQRRRRDRPRALPGHGRAAHRPARRRARRGLGAPARRPARCSAWSMLALVVALAGAALVVHRHPGPAVEHPGDRRARAAAGALAAPTGSSRTPTTSRWSSRASRCRWCTPPGSPRVVFTVLNAVLLTVRIRVENAALAHPARDAGSGAADARPGGRRRRPGRAGHRAVRRAGRARRRRARAARAAPIDKACGEGLMPGAVADLPDLGVDLAGTADRRHPLRRRAARSAEAPFRAGAGRGVRRTALHAALAGRRRRAPASPSSTAPVRDGRATPATTCSSTASRRATSSRPTACTRRSAGCSASTRRCRGRAPLRAARATSRSRRGRVRRGALVARSARPT